MGTSSSGGGEAISGTSAACAAARAIAALRRPRTSTYAYSDNGSINSRRRRASRSSVGDVPVARSNRFNCARTSVSVKALVSNVLKSFSSNDVSATVLPRAGSWARCGGGAIGAGRVGPGGDCKVSSGAVSESAFCAPPLDTAACDAARLFASLSRLRTLTCAYSGRGAINSRRRRISTSSVGDAPVSSSRFSWAKT